MNKIVLVCVLLCFCADGMDKPSRRTCCGKLDLVPVECNESSPHQLNIQLPQEAKELCQRTSILTEQMHRMEKLLIESIGHFEKQIEKLTLLQASGHNTGNNKEGSKQNGFGSSVSANHFKTRKSQVEKPDIELPKRAAAVRAEKDMKLLTREQRRDLLRLSDGDDDYTPESDEESNHGMKRPHKSPSKNSPHKQANKSPTRKQTVINLDDGEESLTEPEDDGTPKATSPRKKPRKSK